MNCKHCKAEWTPPANISITNCPFCHKPLIESSCFGDSSKPDKILLEIVSRFGKQKLTDVRLSSILRDLMPHVERKYQRIFEQAANDGIGTKLLDMENENEALRTAKIHSLKDAFRKNNGFDQTAEYVIDCFLYALGWIDKAEEKNDTIGVNASKIIQNLLEKAMSDGCLKTDETELIFSTGIQLNLSEAEISRMINDAIKLKGFKPAKILDDNTKNHKEILLSCDWNIKSNKENKNLIIKKVGAKTVEIEWVDIPAGTFIMGSPENEVGRESNEVQHHVSLSSFKMSKYAITFEQYDLFCDATGRSKPSDEGWGRNNRPVINVSWDDSTAFAKWMGCRLPTEAEWEYACRAGTKTPFNTGNNLTTDQANYDGNYPYNNSVKGEFRGKTLPVGSFSPNAWGLYDMHGNVWEWCNDLQDDSSILGQAVDKGEKISCFRRRRGGCWQSPSNNCRSADRRSFVTNYRNNDIGFRVVINR